MIVSTGAQVVHAYLKAQAILQNTSPTQSWWGTIGKKATDPANHIVVYSPPGITEGRARGDYVVKDAVHILVRGSTYPTGMARMKAILTALAQVGKNGAAPVIVTVGSGGSAEDVLFLGFALRGAAGHIGQETDGVRELFSMNGTVTLQEPES
jgi:hypothetical protein